jgi:hypothetical protein
MAIPMEIGMVVPAAVKIASLAHANHGGVSIAKGMMLMMVPIAYIAAA